MIDKNIVLTDNVWRQIQHMVKIAKKDMNDSVTPSAVIDTILHLWLDQYSTPEQQTKIILDRLNYRD